MKVRQKRRVVGGTCQLCLTQISVHSWSSGRIIHTVLSSSYVFTYTCGYPTYPEFLWRVVCLHALHNKSCVHTMQLCAWTVVVLYCWCEVRSGPGRENHPDNSNRPQPFLSQYPQVEPHLHCARVNPQIQRINSVQVLRFYGVIQH